MAVSFPDADRDAWLHGWDATPGIVSVHADWDGTALVWRRHGERVTLERARFRPFVVTRDLADLAHLGSRVREDDEHADFSVTHLSGGQGTLRFLVRARDGRALKRELLAGAQRRLKRPVTTLRDLRGYHVLQPTEQYLTCTGRTYFKDMTFDDPHRLQFDLETTSLDPHDGRVFMIAVRDNRGMELTLEAPGPEDEARLIRDFVQLVRRVDPDVIENHNIMGFDLPYLMHRAGVHRVPLDLGRAGGPRGLWRVQDGHARAHYACAGREIVDTLDAARRPGSVTADVAGRGLKALAVAFGIASEDRVYLEGSDIARTYARDPQRVRAYALQDVAEVAALAERLLAPYFTLAQMTPRPYHRLPYAGTATGMLEPMLVRAYLHARHALPGDQPAGAEPHQGGSVHLFAEGVLPRVVKADIASLYPSLIRTYRIRPACDPLGVFLHLVDVLTERRLRHKRDAAHASPGSRDAGQHAAAQAAMKVVINSAYGYLGAGGLALFGDARAADEVTARGREVLRAVLAGLRAQGVTLIEADTDGVYFSVPDDWDEERERRAVHAAGEQLPPLVRLEYEGRYAAMLSHEVKNYALLTLHGRVILRGAALRSSRAEPYGERFLERALRCLLAGDVPGVRRTFEDTVRAVRAHDLPCRDVATTVRLTKTPEAYRHARATRREAAYEVLLRAGRTHWEVGERVRFYRRRDGTDAPLPEDDASDTRDYDAAHYVGVLVSSYASRLRKAFSPEDHQQLFRTEGQAGLFDRPIADIRATFRLLPE